ncbi:superoxide dismutase family protein [Saccharomonospora halophila]|uniref:superoxide dismutase family protein n=1 Tax=Saccharomonospora halophila TaxID=129922 RepID=UPI000372151A|nr:superoxide dismutase family protein [Saccharomonospora halophila]
MRNRTTPSVVTTTLTTTALLSALALGGAGTATARDDDTDGTDTGRTLSDATDVAGSALTGGTDSVQLPFTGITVTAAYGTFDAPGEGADDPAAITYREDLVPVGSAARVVSVAGSSSGTVIKLKVEDLRADRGYGAHVHTDPCGPAPADAGGHYQHRQDPDQPSTDPAYANPDNEIWLDFTTDDTGAAEVESSVEWSFGERRPSSVVLHEHHTLTGEGEAGVAGDRLACLDVDF